MGEFQEWKPIFKRIGKLVRGVVSSYLGGYEKELEKKPKGAGKTYTCKQCGATFNNAPALANHIRWRHPKPKAGK